MLVVIHFFVLPLQTKRSASLFFTHYTLTTHRDETVLTVNGAAYKEVPLIVTKVYDEKPAQYKPQFTAPKTQSQTLKDKVEKLFRQGMQIEDIAMELSCPSSEVQFIIDML